jgi:hypothetical protein
MSTYLTLLYQALASPYGLVVAHESPESARSLFYDARKRHGDPDLDLIKIILVPDEPSHLYLFHPPENAGEARPEDVPCPKSLPAESTSGSTPKTSNGSDKPFPTTLALAKPSGK